MIFPSAETPRVKPKIRVWFVVCLVGWLVVCLVGCLFVWKTHPSPGVGNRSLDVCHVHVVFDFA